MVPSSSLFNKYNKLLTSASSAASTQSTSSKKQNKILEAQKRSGLYDDTKLFADPLDAPKEEKRVTLGKGWFDLEPLKVDDKLKQDLEVIRMRNYLDPKRFYKNPDKMDRIVHVGTIIEGPTEYKTARLSKKERKTSIVQEILGDSGLKSYNKRTFLAIQEEKGKKLKMYKSSKKKRKF
eukprot:gene29884-36080_t